MKDMSNNTDAPTADQQLIEKAREFVRSRYGKPQSGEQAAHDEHTARVAAAYTAEISARLSLAVEALEHYADEWHWTGCGEGDESLTAGYYEDVWCYREPGNGYDIARQALANIKGEGGEDK